jgi:hypothetical protein
MDSKSRLELKSSLPLHEKAIAKKDAPARRETNTILFPTSFVVGFWIVLNSTKGAGK